MMLTSDAFVREFINDVLCELRIHHIIDQVRPYSTVRLSRLAIVRTHRSLTQLLNMSVENLEALIVSLILDGRINGTVDEISKVLQLSKTTTTTSDSLKKPLTAWMDELIRLSGAISSKQGMSVACLMHHSQ